jgi:hypothetical protein
VHPCTCSLLYSLLHTVDIRWDVKPIQAGPSSPSAAPPRSHPATSSQLSVVLPSDAPCVRVEVSMRVVFSRKCLFKKVSPAQLGCKQAAHRVSVHLPSHMYLWYLPDPLPLVFTAHPRSLSRGPTSR